MGGHFFDLQLGAKAAPNSSTWGSPKRGVNRLNKRHALLNYDFFHGSQYMASCLLGMHIGVQYHIGL